LRGFGREAAGLIAGRRPDRDTSHNGLGAMADEESERSAAVLETIQALGAAARSRTSSDPWQRLLEMSSRIRRGDDEITKKESYFAKANRIAWQ
jgi:hypothetical protein